MQPSAQGASMVGILYEILYIWYLIKGLNVSSKSTSVGFVFTAKWINLIFGRLKNVIFEPTPSLSLRLWFC